MDWEIFIAKIIFIRGMIFEPALKYSEINRVYLYILFIHLIIAFTFERNPLHRYLLQIVIMKSIEAGHADQTSPART